MRLSPFPGLTGVQANFTNATSMYFAGVSGRTNLLSANLRF
jgi:hypothetical protein